MTQRFRRAAPLPPEQRRAAILRATVPLLREHGLDVTTRQIAAAAGVAEGTLFRVFPDKGSLLEAAVAHALDPGPLLDELTEVPVELPLEERLMKITVLLMLRLQTVVEITTAVRLRRPEAVVRDAARAGTAQRGYAECFDAVERLLEPDRDQLGWSPREVVRLLRVLVFAGSHDGITHGEPLTAPEIVAVLLDGVRRRERTTGSPRSDPDQMPADRALARPT